MANKSVLKLFSVEVIRFSKSNWWVYIIYFFLLYFILETHSGNLFSVITITSLHFIADIFIMMMLSANQEKNFLRGAKFQTFAMILFLLLKISSGIYGGGWHYLVADPIYALGAIKNYQKNAFHKEIKSINYYTMLLLSLAIILLVILPIRNQWPDSILTNTGQWLQFIGLLVFGTALTGNGSDSIGLILIFTGLACMIMGSAMEINHGIVNENRKIVGFELSYFLLPLTVFVFQLKNLLRKIS